MIFCSVKFFFVGKLVYFFVYSISFLFCFKKVFLFWSEKCDAYTFDKFSNLTNMSVSENHGPHQQKIFCWRVGVIWYHPFMNAAIFLPQGEASALDKAQFWGRGKAWSSKWAESYVRVWARKCLSCHISKGKMYFFSGQGNKSTHWICLHISYLLQKPKLLCWLLYRLYNNYMYI